MEYIIVNILGKVQYFAKLLTNLTIRLAFQKSIMLKTSKKKSIIIK